MAVDGGRDDPGSHSLTLAATLGDSAMGANLPKRSGSAEEQGGQTEDDEGLLGHDGGE